MSERRAPGSGCLFMKGGFRAENQGGLGVGIGLTLFVKSIRAGLRSLVRMHWAITSLAGTREGMHGDEKTLAYVGASRVQHRLFSCVR